MPLHAQAWQRALAPLGVRVSRRAIYEWEGESGVVSARTLLSRRGGRPSRAEVDAVLHAKERLFQVLARHVRVPGRLHAMLRRLRRRGVKLALVTGTSWQEVRRVVAPAVRRQFGTIVTGDRVRRGKPHPEPYLTAMRRLGAAPSRTWVVENAPYGLRSARRARAGRVVALASSLPARYLHDAHVIVHTHARLAGLLDEATRCDTMNGTKERG